MQQQLKYSQWIPDLVKQHIPDEINAWKSSMIEMFERALAKKDWAVLLAALRIFTR